MGHWEGWHTLSGWGVCSHRGINQNVGAHFDGWGVGIVMGGSTRRSDHMVKGAVLV